MATVLYFDCFSGISGDMALGALVDAGLPLDDLRAALGSLAVGARIAADRVLRTGVSATKFSVDAGEAERVHQHHHEHDHVGGEGQAHHHDHPHEHRPHEDRHTDHHDHQHDDRRRDHRHDHGGKLDHAQQRGHEPSHEHSHSHQHDHPPAGAAVGNASAIAAASHPLADHSHRTLADIARLIDRSSLSPAARDRANEMFRRLGEAEAEIHGTTIDRVHLHEVGALDSIIDIAGIAYAMEWANADRVVCSPLNVGGGVVHSAHGVFPVPAPATLKLLGDAPIYSGRVQKELVTPTGALIATTYASAFGPIPPMTVDRIGYGAGDRDDPITPNVLRVLIGREAVASPGDRVTVVECEIDDMNPQIFGVVMDRLYAAGALEVFFTPVQMKKNRPGTLLTIVTAPEKRTAISDIVFAETTTIGLRYYDVDRDCLQRELVTVETPVGPIRFKVATRGGRVVNATPEFDDCAAIAREKGISVKDVQAIAVAAYGARA